MAVGAYMTACEASPNKMQIDIWLNENKSSMWISRELKKQFNESISDKAVSKYRKYREEFLQKEIEQTPEYQGKISQLNEQLIDGIGKIRQVDIMGKLADTIDQMSEMLADARDRDIQIKNAQDIRFISQAMLDAIKIYGDTVLKAQRFNAVNEDPTLLKPTTININVKTALIDMMKGVMENGNGYEFIDQLRAGTQLNDDGRNEGDTSTN